MWNDSVRWNDTLRDSRKMDPKMQSPKNMVLVTVTRFFLSVASWTNSPGRLQDWWRQWYFWWWELGSGRLWCFPHRGRFGPLRYCYINGCQNNEKTFKNPDFPPPAFPWQSSIAVVLKSKKKMHLCSAVILSSRHVLTAARWAKKMTSF